MRKPIDQKQELAIRHAAHELLREWEEVSPHPDVALLVAYQEERLQTSDAEQVRLHLVSCTECAQDLDELEMLEPDSEEDPALFPDPQLTAAAWQKLHERLDEGEPSQPPATNPEILARGTTSPGLWLTAAMIGAVGLAVFWIGQGATSKQGEIGQLEALWDHPWLVELSPDGEGIQRSLETQTVHPSREVELLVLRLLLGDLKAYDAYRAWIVDDATQATVWEQEDLIRQKNGEFMVLVPTNVLPAGQYRIELMAVSGADPLSLATYTFKIKNPSDGE